MKIRPTKLLRLPSWAYAVLVPRRTAVYCFVTALCARPTWLRSQHYFARQISSIFIAVFSLFWLIYAQAEIIENDKRIVIRTIEPERDVGYTVGDIISRTVILEAPKPLVLVETSLPVPGNEKKRRGRGSGIEVREVTLEKSAGIDKTTYTLHLTYQVFTNNIVARPANLPAEFVKFNGKNETFDFRIPSWGFRISPLAVYGSVVVEKDMSTFRGPLLLDTVQPYRILWGLLASFGIALLGLLYVLGSITWLPRMGGPFARAYRDLKKLPATAEGLSLAIARLHLAFNATAGSSVFDKAVFLEHKPGFAPVGAEIEHFFGLSRSVFFEPTATHNIEGDPLTWLKQFCLKCRNCERGLK
jgi:mxaA protein